MMLPVDSQTFTIRHRNICIHRWPHPETTSPRALIVIFHGFLAHGLYPTVRYAAELLAAPQHRYAVVSADLPGHGRSEGLAGYLESCESLLEDATAIAEYIIQTWYPSIPKIFFLGSSMGGALALAVAQRMTHGSGGGRSSSSSSSDHQGNIHTASEQTRAVDGVVLLAPMLRLGVGSLAQSLLDGLTLVVPTWKLIPSSSTSAGDQYRDPDRRRECEEDPFITPGGTIRVGSAHTCVQLTQKLQRQFGSITNPLLILLADGDVVVKNEGAEELMEEAASVDKTLRRYPALHGLLCEPKPLRDTIEKDIVDWIHQHCS